MPQRYRRFGRTEQQLSAFSLGTMRLVNCPESVACQTVVAAIEWGINHIETAQAYGISEVRLGKILSQEFSKIRDRLTITTKLVPTLAPHQLREALERSLERLQLDYIDNFAFHGINLPEHLEQVLNGGLQVMQQAVAEGLVKHIGFSTHGSLDLIEKAIATNAFDFVNLHYYYFNQRNQAAIALAAQRDMGVFIISPADKGGMLYQPPQSVVDLCSPFSPLEFGYRYLLENPAVHTLSLGAAQPSDLDAAFASLAPHPTWESTQTAIDTRIQQALATNLGSDRCSHCFQCLPCPESINIPEVLRLRNLDVGLDMTEFAHYRYNMFGKAGHWFPGTKGDRCTECGDCLPRCPEELNIPQLVFDAHERLNIRTIRRLWE
ncbi:MAG: aldo/keto reductase [Synechococcus sp.]